MADRISAKTVGRLSLYRRLLTNRRQQQGDRHVYSHELADMASVTAAQVRRDIMAVGYSGSKSRGYEIETLLARINAFLDSPRPQRVALVGVGNLGRAVLAFFSGRRPNLKIVAAFDKDPHKIGRVIMGCRCFAIDDLEAVVSETGIWSAIIAVPAGDAQDVADRLVRADVRGILNFAPIPLHLPPATYVEDIDFTMSLDKVAYFSRRNGHVVRQAAGGASS